MAQDSWPSPAHNSRQVTDPEYERIAALFSGDGVYGDPTDTAVVSAGVGLNVNVRANVFASVRGHAWTSGTTTVTLPITANASGQTRVDRIVLRLDRSTWTVRARVKEGTPGAGVPTLTQQTGDTGVYEILLANVTVLNGAAAVTVARGERYVGTRVRVTTSTALTDPNPLLGEVRYETDTGRLRLYDGTALRTIFEDSGVIGVNSSLSAWSNEVESVVQLRNGVVTLRLGSFKRLSGALAATDESRLPVTIPAAYRHPTRDIYVLAYLTGAAIGRLIVYSKASDRAGQVWLTNKPALAKDSYVLPESGQSWTVDS
ncbi:hypothetical protein AB0465_11220 [Streptomyces griseoviridis]|uniref:hypothetical protein n=1 Tax=Streptomyces griseoviridis TaxID=45398 RepID=UPI00344C26DE